jgi:DNA-directed RNA polymerase subunit beta'
MGFSYFKQRELRVKERFHQTERTFFESLLLGIASPEQIRGWAQRTLPNGSVVGEVLCGKTVDYKTLKPLRNGLFCERIFGPVKDFHCACGKRQPNDDVSFCPECEVEYYPATIRRHRMGYIELCSGCVHIWYFKGRPNYLSILLKRKRKSLEALIYCTTVLVNAHSLGLIPKRIVSDSIGVPANQVYRPGHTIPVSTSFCCDVFRQRDFFEYIVSVPEPGDRTIRPYCSGEKYNKKVELLMQKGIEEQSTVGMSFKDLLLEYENERDAKVRQTLNALGGQAIVNMMNNVNFHKLRRILAAEIREFNPPIRELASIYEHTPSEQRKLTSLVSERLAYIRRFKLIQTFIRTKRNPAWMVLFALPVLPPTIRPISIMENGTLYSSDLNRLYQRLVHRNSRMRRSVVLDTETIGFHQRLVQDAVDAVLENGKGGSIPVLSSENRPLKSLADRLKGKHGRFRLHLLGKRVDYSGRSVIVVGPKMRLHECGLPREMAIQLFSPFLIRRLLELGYVDNFLRAKIYLQIEHPIIWPTLLEIMGQYPILLNRAPTLHRLGIQAFQPRLVSTHAILLHPLVCSAFNADFDGDQMAVHVPLSFQARSEAWKLLWSRNNLLAPATGDPILAPSQDMILGSYYLTTNGQPNKGKRAALALPPMENPPRLAPPIGTCQGFVNQDYYFNDFEEAMLAFHQDFISIRTPIWLRLPLNQTSQNGKKPKEPEELQIHANGLGFAVFNDIQQRRHWSLSTDQQNFLTAYATILSHFVQTTAGRILVNQLMTGGDIAIPDRIQKRMDDELMYIFEQQLLKEEQADALNERLWHQAIAELKPLFKLPGIPGEFE